MSAVLDLMPAAQVAMPEAPRCATCRHSRHSSDGTQLLCTQPRSPAINGVAIRDTRTAPPSGVRKDCADRCKLYQEER